MLFNKIIEDIEIMRYLNKRNLMKQYLKAKHFLLLGMYSQVKFGIREPKSNEIYYFRINKQYRAYCIIENNELRIFEINNHQN